MPRGLEAIGLKKLTFLKQVLFYQKKTGKNTAKIELSLAYLFNFLTWTILNLRIFLELQVHFYYQKVRIEYRSTRRTQPLYI